MNIHDRINKYASVAASRKFDRHGHNCATFIANFFCEHPLRKIWHSYPRDLPNTLLDRTEWTLTKAGFKPFEGDADVGDVVPIHMENGKTLGLVCANGRTVMMMIKEGIRVQVFHEIKGGWRSPLVLYGE